MRTRTPHLLVAALLALPAACSATENGTQSDTTADDAARTPVILDYSPTTSDLGALLYLAARPDVDLLAVTLPATGEADCASGVRTTRAALALAARTDVPVGCGSASALAQGHPWPPAFRDAANSLGDLLDLPAVADTEAPDAVGLLVDTLRRADDAVTVVAVAPLTNIALALEAGGVRERVGRLVIMGGAVDASGNVDAAPAAEWNFHVDPGAARRVLAAPVDVLLVGLDATNHVPWTSTLVARLGTLDAAPARAVQRLVADGRSRGLSLWDELAAVVALDPSVVTVAHRRLSVDDAGATVDDFRGREIAFADSADPQRAVDEWLGGLQGGPLPAVRPLDGTEAAYLGAVDRATDDVARQWQQLFRSTATDAADPAAAASALAAAFVAALHDLRDGLMVLVAPAAFARTHADLVGALEEIDRRADDLLAAVAAQRDGDPWERLTLAAASRGMEEVFQRVTLLCESLSGTSQLRGGPALCESD